MNFFDIESLINDIQESNTYYKSFIDTENMDVGVLHLKPDQEDNQLPHDKDEVYFILQGDGYFEIGNEIHKIVENRFYFVPKEIKHRLFANNKNIIAIYFFGS